VKPRIVMDTNVLVSGLLGGTATEVIRQWREGAFTLIVSAEIVTEYEAVLSRSKLSCPSG
jgi:putative PIN family toxin of toxin-antitoxin system